MRTRWVVAGGGVLAIVVMAGVGPAAHVQHASPEFAKLGEEFRQFVSPVFPNQTIRTRRPITGVPDYAAEVRQQREGLPRFQARLKEIDPRGWPVHDQVDYLLLRAEMDYVDWQHRVLRETVRNPYLYVEQAFDGVRREMGAVVPYSVEKAEAIIRAFERTSPIVEQGPKNIVLAEAAPEFARMVVRDVKDIRQKYAAGVKLMEPHVPQSHRARLAAAAERAAAALEDYGRWVDANRSQMRGQPHVGRENLQWLLKRVFFVPWSHDELLYMAELEMNRFRMMIEIEEKKNEGLKPLTMPTSEEWVEWFRLTYLQTKYWLKDLDLISFHPFIGESYLETGGVWQEPFGAGLRTGLMSFPTEPTKEPGKRLFVVPEDHWFTQTYFERLMRIDPIVDYHHSDWPGHYFEAQVTTRNPCFIRAGHRDSGFSNWAHYLEELFLNFDYPFLRGPRTRELHYNLLLFRAVRVPLDFHLSSGVHSIDESVQFQINLTPFLEEHVSRGEVENYVRQPFSASSYIIGKKQIEQILGERIVQLGGPGGHAGIGEPQKSRFNWRDFHDTLLASGQIPLSLVRWEMTGHDDQVKKFWNTPDLATDLKSQPRR